MKKTLIILFFPLVIFSQKVTSKNIDLIAYDKATAKIYFYKKDEFESVYSNDKFKTLDSLKKYTIYNLNQLKLEKQSDYLNRINHLWKEVNIFSDKGTLNRESVLMSINPSVALFRNVYFHYTRNGIPKKELEDFEHNPTFLKKQIVKTGAEKFITLFFAKDRLYSRKYHLKYCYLSMPNEDVLLGNSKTIKLAVKNTISKKIVDKFSNYEYYKAKDFYSIKKDNGKYRLFDHYKFDVLNKSYDSIHLENQFIITYLGKITEIYNPKFRKDTYQNVEQIYFRNEGYEILTKTDAFSMHQDGYKVNQLTFSIPHFLCGTVSYDSRRIKKSKKAKFQYKIIEENDLDFTLNENIFLKGLPKDIDSISFLDGKKWYSFSPTNSPYLGVPKSYGNKILTYKKGKIGLYSYDSKQKKELSNEKRDENELEIIPIDDFFNYFVTVKEEVPIGNSKILFNKHDGVIKIKTNNSFTFLYDKNPKTYDKVEKKSLAFYKVYKNGKSGFFDVLRQKEYGF